MVVRSSVYKKKTPEKRKLSNGVIGSGDRLKLGYNKSLIKINNINIT